MNDGCCGGHRGGSCDGRRGTYGRHGGAHSDRDHRLRVFLNSTNIILF